MKFQYDEGITVKQGIQNVIMVAGFSLVVALICYLFEISFSDTVIGCYIWLGLSALFIAFPVFSLIRIIRLTSKVKQCDIVYAEVTQVADYAEELTLSAAITNSSNRAGCYHSLNLKVVYNGHEEFLLVTGLNGKSVAVVGDTIRVAYKDRQTFFIESHNRVEIIYKHNSVI